MLNIKRVVALLGVLMLIPSMVFSQGIKDITWMTEQYPPYNFMGLDGKPVGMTVDTLLKVFEKVGGGVDRSQIKILPWARSYRSLESTPNMALFSMTYTDERLKLFDFIGPAAPSNIVVMAKISDHIKVTNKADLNKLKIGVIRDDIGDQLLIKAGVNDANIQRSAKAENLVKKLNAGRVNAIAYDSRVAAWHMKNVSVDPSLFEAVYTLKQGEMGYAFHKGTDPALLKSLQKALDELIANGEIKKIAEKYLK